MNITGGTGEGDKKKTDDKISAINQYFALIFFIIVFAMIIPYVLASHNLYDILEMYYPNLDLMATCLNLHGGPNNSDIFKYLYLDDDPFVGYISVNTIALLSMVGVFVVLLKRLKRKLLKSKTKDISDNSNLASVISTGTIMLIITFFFPNRYINQFNEFVYATIKNYTNIDETSLWYLTVFIGFIFSFLIIKTEAVVNKSFINSRLEKVFEFLLDKKNVKSTIGI